MILRVAGYQIVITLGLLLSTVQAVGATPEEVNSAIEKARVFLHKHENADGNWEEVNKAVANGGKAEVKGKQWGGLTAIASYALLAAGDDPRKDLAKPIEFLKQAEIEGIYALGLRCQVWLLDDADKKLKPAIEKDKETLLSAVHQQSTKPDELGFYAYYFDKGPQPADWYDRSVSQYGVLGMWALEQAGAEIPQKYWELVDGAWKHAQNPDGGWNYQKGHKGGASTAPMTAAGIATLFITQDYMLGNLADCHGNIVNKNIEHGLGWMDKNIKQALSGSFYGMYGIERIGVASGRKYFETVDWYQEGAEFIVKHQKPDGSWGTGIPDTCFCLLFLSRGRAPVVMNKLEYSLIDKNGKAEEGPWNERPRDCANFARWMGRSIEHDLNWQTVNLKVKAEELHDSPILYISGNKELAFSDADLSTLRTFAEEGGLILGNADCGQPTFAQSFAKLGTKLFPKYEFRELSNDHPIFQDQQFKPAKWHNRPKVMGLSNGVRELMLLVPESDLSRAWQARNEKTREELYQLAANIFLYAVDKKNLKYKGDTYIVKEKPEIKITRSAMLARLEIGENWDPEPAGWHRMKAILHNEDRVALTVKSEKCDSQSLKDIKVAHLTGTATFKLSDVQRKAIKDFVEGGGTLIADAAGGDAAYATAVEAELAAIFGNMLETMPPESPVLNLPGSKIENVKFRMFARRLLTGDLKSPRIREIKVKGRPAVFYSREDLSAGLVGEQIDGIIGYDPASATALMRNLVLFGAFGTQKPPANEPAPKAADPPAKHPSSTPKSSKPAKNKAG